jgi:hypothetical protein
MSIIYDALKKVDGGNKSPEPPSPKSKNNIGFIIAAVIAVVLIGAAIFYVTRKNFHLDIKPLAVFKNASLGNSGRPGQKKMFNTYVLEGIIYDDKGPIAVINGQVLHQGEKIDNLELKKIEAKSVELLDSQDNSPVKLSL